MKVKRKREPLTDAAVENTIEAFHLVFAIAPAIAAIVTFVVRRDLHLIVELGLIAVVIVVNFCVLWLRSKTDKTEELSLFHTFWTNKVKPPKSGMEQNYNVSVAIVEDETKSYFREALQNEFKTEFDFQKLKSLLSGEPRLRSPALREPELKDFLVERKDRNLFFKPIEVGTLDADPQKSLRDFKHNLNDNLQYATAVVFVRTSALNSKACVYEALDAWGDEHSEVAILNATAATEKTPNDQHASNFLRIPDDPKSLPWRLLQRALTRARVWRTQATYNRAMVWNITYIALMFIYIGVIWAVFKNEEAATQKSQSETALATQKSVSENALDSQRIVNEIVMNGMNSAITTEKLFRDYPRKKADSTLSVSYWYRIDGKPHIFVTTESPHSTTDLENNNSSIIGCAFVHPNLVIEGTVGSGQSDPAKVTAYNNYDDPFPIPECQMAKLPKSKVKSIFCASYDETVRTVGVCVFTRDDYNDLTKMNKKTEKKARDFLRERTQQFQKDFIPLIENNRAFSLAEREPKASGLHK